MGGSDIWVKEYTTASGVHVAGHWRTRGSTAGGSDHLGGDQPAVLGQSTATVVPAPATRATSPAHSLTGAAEDRPAVGRSRLEAAQERYKAALVTAGLSSLRHRQTGDREALQAALQERAQAHAELQEAQSEADRGADANSHERCGSCGQFQGPGHQCPTPEGLPDTSYAGLKGDDRVRAMVADLETSVQAIVQSGQLQRWLDAMSSNGLNRWSANNRILATVQMLARGESISELHLMGFRQWEKHNRNVSRGAKAVFILAPITRKITEVKDDGSEEDKHRVVGFKSVPVFNISDTHGDPLPEAPVRSAEGKATPGTLTGLRSRVADAGYDYEETEIPGCEPATGRGTLGYTDPANKRIVIDSRLSEAQKASTIAHELGHVHCGHVDGDYSEYQQHRGQMETEAEMTAYLVNRARGMSRDQVDAFSPGYIASWSKGDATKMHTAVDKATRAFNKITEGAWPENDKER